MVAGLILLPLLAVAWKAAAQSDALAHLAATVLPRYVGNTLLLMAGVALGVAMLGTGAAWLVSRYHFPFVGIMSWALALPLAVPGYLAAFVYTDLLEYAGPVQGFLREMFGWQRPTDYWFPEIRSHSGAVLMFTLTLYPYVYLLARTAFQAQSAHLMEAARLLGRGPWRAFFSVALPVAWPAIAAGVALALMETLNDLGVVAFFAVPTLTVGVFDVWLNMNDVTGAVQIALLMLAFVLVLLVLERTARRKRRFDAMGRTGRQLQLTGGKAILALFACLLPVVAGFGIPIIVLLGHASRFWEVSLQQGLLTQLGNSLLVASITALITSALALLMVWAARLDASRAVRAAVRLSGMGYAVPGAVLAIGLLYPLAQVDNWVNRLAEPLQLPAPGLLLSGTVVALIYGYTVRFMALSLGAVESGMARISPNMEDAARTLGLRPARVLRRVHLPLLRSAVLTGALIVFVDVIKELPITMLLRPFNFETLATISFQFASEEMFEEAALHALVIVLVGMLPLILLSRTMQEQGNKQ